MGRKSKLFDKSSKAALFTPSLEEDKIIVNNLYENHKVIHFLSLEWILRTLDECTNVILQKGLKRTEKTLKLWSRRIPGLCPSIEAKDMINSLTKYTDFIATDEHKQTIGMEMVFLDCIGFVFKFFVLESAAKCAGNVLTEITEKQQILRENILTYVKEQTQNFLENDITESLVCIFRVEYVNNSNYWFFRMLLQLLKKQVKIIKLQMRN